MSYLRFVNDSLKFFKHDLNTTLADLNIYCRAFYKTHWYINGHNCIPLYCQFETLFNAVEPGTGKVAGNKLLLKASPIINRSYIC